MRFPLQPEETSLLASVKGNKELSLGSSNPNIHWGRNVLCSARTAQLSTAVALWGHLWLDLWELCWLARVGRLIRVSIIFGDVNRGHPGEGGLASHRARWRWHAHRSELDQLVAHDAVQRGHQGS